MPMILTDPTGLMLLLAGPAIGSFVRLAADRAGTGRGVLGPPSACEQCGRRLAARDLVPILSFAVSGGRSRCCGGPIRAALPAAEIAGLAIALWAVLATDGWARIAAAGLGWTLLGLALTDLRLRRLPDAGTLPLLLAGLGVSLAGLSGPPLWHAAGAAAGYALFAGIAAGYARIRGIEGLGLGDAKLLAAGGAWCGLAALPSILLWACAAGLALAFATGVAQGRLHARTAIPFGPALALGIWLTWVHGPLVFG